MEITIIDNSAKTKEELHDAVLRALEKCGLQGENYAKQLAPSPGKYGTGNLKNSITHQVFPSEQEVHIGTPVEYGKYLELGTGKYATQGGGRPTPWAWQDDKGNWHMTHGQRAKPYLKPAVADNASTYQQIIEGELKNG